MKITVDKSYYEGEEGRRRLIRVIAKSSALRGIEHVANQIAEVAVLHDYAPGATLIEQGADDDDILFLLKGKASVRVNGVEVNTRCAEKSEHVGEMSLIDPPARRSASIIALDHVIAAVISEPAFSKLADEHSTLWRNLALELADRLRQRNILVPNHYTITNKLRPIISLTDPDWLQVIEALKNIEPALKKWTWEDDFKGNRIPIKWDIDNEYHVQNLLYTVLRPIFPDLLEEECIESIGHKHPRLDLLIPSLDLIIEAKFIRKNVSFAKITEELAADATLYRTKNGGTNRRVIAFIWDDSCRVQHHETLRQSVQNMPGIEEVIIVSRPGNFLREPKPDGDGEAPPVAANPSAA